MRGCGEFGVRSILTLHGRHRTPGYDDQGEDSNSVSVKHAFTVSRLGAAIFFISLCGPSGSERYLGRWTEIHSTYYWFN